MANTKNCPRCDGSGRVSRSGKLKECGKCSGDGYVKKGIHEKMSKENRQALGTGGGAVAGFAWGGPVGAALGAAAGYVLSDSDDDEDMSGR